jgi:hypothetical protein
MTHKIAVQLHLLAESCTICSSSSRRPVRKLLDNLRTCSWYGIIKLSTVVQVLPTRGLRLHYWIPFRVPAGIRWYSDCLRAGWPGFVFRHRQRFYLLSTASWPILGHPPPIVLSNEKKGGALSLGVKRPGREAYHLPPSSAEVNNSWKCTSTNPTCLHDVVLN